VSPASVRSPPQPFPRPSTTLAAQERAPGWEAYLGSLRANGAPARSKARGTSPRPATTDAETAGAGRGLILRLRSPRTEALRKWATGIAVRRGKKIAIVALARRMTGVILAMMRDRTCYLQPALLALAAQVA